MSWKDGLITAEQMRNRNSNEELGPEISLIKKILKLAENSWFRTVTYFVIDEKKYHLLPKVVSKLCELGYDASFTKNKDLAAIHISW